MCSTLYRKNIIFVCKNTEVKRNPLQHKRNIFLFHFISTPLFCRMSNNNKQHLTTACYNLCQRNEIDINFPFYYACVCVHKMKDSCNLFYFSLVSTVVSFSSYILIYHLNLHDYFSFLEEMTIFSFRITSCLLGE